MGLLVCDSSLCIPVASDKMNIKCVVVGDGAVGKTCLLSSYVENVVPEDYMPTTFDNTVVELTVNNVDVTIGLWDTAGVEDYDRLRPVAYPGADVFLLCFALNLKSSAENIKERWHPELVHYCPQAPIILVGTKLDCRQNAGRYGFSKQMVSRSEGQRIAKAIKAARYVECSALTREGLDDVFQEAVLSTLQKQSSSHSRAICAVL